jgi:hypothetical protein
MFVFFCYWLFCGTNWGHNFVNTPLEGRALILKHIVQLPIGQLEFEDRGLSGFFLKEASDARLDSITNSFVRFTIDEGGTGGTYNTSYLHWQLPSAQGTTTILELEQGADWSNYYDSGLYDEISEALEAEWDKNFAQKNPNCSPNDHEIAQKKARVAKLMDIRIQKLYEQRRIENNKDWFAGTGWSITIRIWQKKVAEADTFRLINEQALPANFQQLMDSKFPFCSPEYIGDVHSKKWFYQTRKETYPAFYTEFSPTNLQIKSPLIKQIFGFGNHPPKAPIPLTESTYQPFNYDLPTQTLRLRFCETYGLDLRWNGAKFELL